MNERNLSAGELRRKYLKAWRKLHPEKVREYNRRYWERKAQKAAAAEISKKKSESEEE